MTHTKEILCLIYCLTFTGIGAAQVDSFPSGISQQGTNSARYVDKQNVNPPIVSAQLGELLGGNIATDEFLHPDVAYVLTTEVRDAKSITVQWSIADGYYLYRDKFKFALENAPGITLGGIELPRGKVKEDQFFGRVEVFYDQVETTITLQRTTNDPTEIMLDVGYQGCADAGLCYPPITKTVPLLLPAAP
jgi:thioredoxin:protein disulfide reductase